MKQSFPASRCLIFLFHAKPYKPLCLLTCRGATVLQNYECACQKSWKPQACALVWGFIKLLRSPSNCWVQGEKDWWELSIFPGVLAIMNLLGALPSYLDLAISCLAFFPCKPSFVPCFYSSRPGMMQPWACSAGWDVRTAALSG